MRSQTEARPDQSTIGLPGLISERSAQALGDCRRPVIPGSPQDRAGLSNGSTKPRGHPPAPPFSKAGRTHLDTFDTHSPKLPLPRLQPQPATIHIQWCDSWSQGSQVGCAQLRSRISSTAPNISFGQYKRRLRTNGPSHAPRHHRCSVPIPEIPTIPFRSQMVWTGSTTERETASLCRDPPSVA
ncbi:hypothetical protein ABW21_db0206852 [Orbilia brochopaga]|nr:hypothetical protein ABW21_db0206852 [Drechslerella brochopaga]